MSEYILAAARSFVQLVALMIELFVNGQAPCQKGEG